MSQILLVSSSGKLKESLTAFLCERGQVQVDTAASASGARRLLLEREYDIVLVDTPLADESGLALALDLSAQGTGSVLLLVRAEIAEQVQDQVEHHGIYVVQKPIVRSVLQSALRFVWASHYRMEQISKNQTRLKQQLEDVKIIDRAKCCLIELLGMSEATAHRHIEKQAMDLRKSRRSVAEDILRTYEV